MCSILSEERGGGARDDLSVAPFINFVSHMWYSCSSLYKSVLRTLIVEMLFFKNKKSDNSLLTHTVVILSKLELNFGDSPNDISFEV